MLPVARMSLGPSSTSLSANLDLRAAFSSAGHNSQFQALQHDHRIFFVVEV
jgi:hypothetical protein